MTVFHSTDRHKSVRNRCVIEMFGGVFVLSIGFRIFRCYRGVCHRSESDLLLFLSIELLPVSLAWQLIFCILHFCHTCSLCRVELVVQFPARGSSQVLLCLFLVCCGCDTFYIVSVQIQCQASVYTLSLCRGHSWRVRLAKQDKLTPPGQLVSPLVSGVRECPPWCSIVGATVTVHQFFCILHWV